MSLSVLLCGCDASESHSSPPAAVSVQAQTPPADTPDVKVALQFMNEYVRFVNSEQATQDSNRWIMEHPLLTLRCREAWLKLMDKAFKDDPELGLGFDPFLNAQDFPDEGFEYKGGKDSAGWFRLSGVGWPDYSVPVKVVRENGSWKVDAAGAVIP